MDPSLLRREVIRRINAAGPDNFRNLRPEVFFDNRKHSETVYYWGSREVFGDWLDFWIACLAWSSGEDDMEYVAPQILLAKSLPDDFWGAFQAISPKEKPLDFTKIHELADFACPGKLKSCFLMRPNWNDEMVLLEYQNGFVVSNWWTSN